VSGCCLLVIVGIVLRPHATSILAVCFQDDIEVCTHVQDIIALEVHDCHVRDEAIYPLEEGVLYLVSMLDKTQT